MAVFRGLFQSSPRGGWPVQNYVKAINAGLEHFASDSHVSSFPFGSRPNVLIGLVSVRKTDRRGSYPRFDLARWQVHDCVFVATSERLVVEVIHVRVMGDGLLPTRESWFVTFFVTFNGVLGDDRVELERVDTRPSDIVLVVAYFPLVFWLGRVISSDGSITHCAHDCFLDVLGRITADRNECVAIVPPCGSYINRLL